MPHIDTGTMTLPFGGRSPRARRTSLQGAQAGVVYASSQASRMLLNYRTHGPMTDLHQHRLLGLPESRISARRGSLMDRGLVIWVDDVMGPHGVENGRYGLTDKGRAIVSKLKIAK